MILKHYTDVKAKAMSDQKDTKVDNLTFIGGTHGVSKRLVIGSKDDAANFVMRVIDFTSNAQSSHHSHPWEHEAFVISGSGTAVVGGKDYTIRLLG
jgi:quercetin dioxygenase-like cupin family protein